MRVLVCICVLLCAATTASGDGGHVRMQQASGNFIITLFTMPEPLTTGDADFSVMVQDRATQQVLLDAAVDLQLTAPSGEVQFVALGSAHAGNRMLQAATVNLGSKGKWAAMVRVSRGSDQAESTIAFDVETDHSRRALVLAFVLLPLLVIALFIVHQSQRNRRGRRTTSFPA